MGSQVVFNQPSNAHNKVSYFWHYLRNFKLVTKLISLKALFKQLPTMIDTIMDKLQLTLRNLGQVFHFVSGCGACGEFSLLESKTAYLKVEKSAQTTFRFSPPLDIVLLNLRLQQNREPWTLCGDFLSIACNTKPDNTNCKQAMKTDYAVKP